MKILYAVLAVTAVLCGAALAQSNASQILALAAVKAKDLSTIVMTARADLALVPFHEALRKQNRPEGGSQPDIVERTINTLTVLTGRLDAKVKDVGSGFLTDDFRARPDLMQLHDAAQPEPALAKSIGEYLMLLRLFSENKLNAFAHIALIDAQIVRVQDELQKYQAKIDQFQATAATKTAEPAR
jgi:hypothetical protein